MNRGLRRLVGVMLGFFWFLVVFAISIYLTFPADAVAHRIRWQVQQGSNGSSVLQLGAVHPWWVGVRLDELAYFNKGRPRRGEAGDAELVFAADMVRVRTGVIGLLNLALLGGNASFSGSTVLEGGELDFSGNVARGEGEHVKLNALRVEGDGFPLNALPAIAGGKLIGTGGLDLDVDLDIPEGFSKSNGHLTLASNDLLIERIEAEALQGFEFGEIRVSKVDVAFDVTEGKAKVTRGSILSDLVQVDVEGDMVLADDLPKSRLRLKVVFTLGEGLAMFSGFLKPAEWEDGKYHYALTGTLERPRFRPERERRARAGGGPRALRGPGADEGDEDEGMPERGARPPGPPAMFDRGPRIDGPVMAGDDDDSRDERTRRREEAIAARRARMPPRGDGEGPRRPDAMDEEEDLPLDEELPSDDELMMEEPPIEPFDEEGMHLGPPDELGMPPEEYEEGP